jgi:hypothetical protein
MTIVQKKRYLRWNEEEGEKMMMMMMMLIKKDKIK